MKTANFITQVAGWILFFSLPVVFMYNQNNQGDLYGIICATSYWFFCITYLALFYLFTFFLIPRLYLTGKYWSYFATVLLLFVGVYLLKPFDRLMSDHQRGNPHVMTMGKPQFGDTPEPPDRKPPAPFPENRRKDLLSFDIVSVFLFIAVTALTMAIQINKQLYLAQKKAIKAEADRSEAELSFLKAQINPHFLYNTLNNIYTLAITSSPNTARSIMMLSNIMRYITDDTKDEMVFLKDELDCIANFIGLQELRLNAKTLIDYEISGIIMHQKVPPLILMTFVENAFKYGLSKQNARPITIKVNLLENGLHFFTQNTDFSANSKLNRTGIGINNTKQRLQYLYPGKHELKINAENGIFTVNLMLYS